MIPVEPDISKTLILQKKIALLLNYRHILEIMSDGEQLLLVLFKLQWKLISLTISDLCIFNFRFFFN